MNIQTQMTGLEQGMKEKIGGDQIQQLRSTFAGIQAQFTSLEQAMHAKIDTTQLQQVKNAVAGHDNKIGGMEQLLQEKLPPGFDHQGLSDSLVAIQGKLSGVERSMWEGMDCVQQLETTISTVKAATSNLEQQVREKVTAQELQQCCDRFGGIQSKVSNLERQVCAGTERAQHAEEIAGSLAVSFNSFKQAMQETILNQQKPIQLQLTPP